MSILLEGSATCACRGTRISKSAGAQKRRVNGKAGKGNGRMELWLKDEKTGMEIGINDFDELFIGNEDSGGNYSDTPENREKLIENFRRVTGMERPIMAANGTPVNLDLARKGAGERMTFEPEMQTGSVGKRIKLKQWQKQMIGEYEKNCGYSLEQITYLLEEEDYLEKFGIYTERVPDPVRRFYRAQGYLEAIKVSCFMKGKRLPETTPSEAERLSQEMAEEVEKAVLKIFNPFLQNEN